MRLFDAHFHLIDPHFPLVANQDFEPEPFTVDDYRGRTAHLDVAGGAVVSGSFQAYDSAYLLDALARLGPGFVGVANVLPDVTDEQVLALARGGVRAFRVNLFRGGDPAQLQHARRFHELAGWHVEVYVDGRDLVDLAPRLRRAPQVVIDHLGMTRAGLPALLDLAARGACVKATGFGRVDLDVPRTLRTIAAVNPAALLFGTDLPGTRARRAFADADIDLVLEHAGPPALYENAAALYRY